MNKNVIGLIKDESGGKIMIEFVALRPKTQFYLTDDDNSVKKAKVTKKYLKEYLSLMIIKLVI